MKNLKIVQAIAVLLVVSLVACQPAANDGSSSTSSIDKTKLKGQSGVQDELSEANILNVSFWG